MVALIQVDVFFSPETSLDGYFESITTHLNVCFTGFSEDQFSSVMKLIIVQRTTGLPHP